jgi:hypothetical protein
VSIRRRANTLMRDAEIEAFGAAADSQAVRRKQVHSDPSPIPVPPQMKALLLRLTAEPHALLAEVAHDDKRSMNTMVLCILIPELKRRQAEHSLQP